jgi:OOP family OmpA-OmpF porin
MVKSAKQKLILYTVIAFTSTTACPAQNLVPNPSFEKYTKCPEWDTNHNFTTDLLVRRKSHIDYFNECSNTEEALDVEQKYTTKSVSVPQNFRGFQYARTGKGYIGMTFNSPEKDIDHCYGDVYCIKLISPLAVGKNYRISFYVSLAATSQYGISNMGVEFCSHYSPTGVLSPTGVVTIYPDFYRQGKPIIDTVNWSKVSLEFTASGYEEFMTIGCLTKNISCTKKDLKSHYKTGYAYYYVDDVCIAEIKPDGTCDCGDEIKKDTTDEKALVIQAGKNIALNNVFFESNKSVLLPASFPELDKLISYLKANNTGNIEISGYTDNTGTADNNIKLSAARAKAVADYIVSKGIMASRVSHKGYGSANPVAGNNTEEGKMKNRRVEFKITNK